MSDETARPGRSRRTVPRWLAVVAAVVLGALVSVQARVSAALADETDVYNGAWVTVLVGTVILVAILVLSKRTRRGSQAVLSALRARTLPWWALVGGLCGMFFVVSQGTAAGVLGLALFGMSVVAGQVAGGLLFDWIGLAGGDRRRPTWLRVVGSVLALGAVSFGAAAGEGAKVDVLLILMAFAAGVGLALSAGVTGRVNATTGDPAASGLVNHVVGLVVIVVVLLTAFGGAPAAFRLPTEPWLYAGGMIGPVGVAMTAVLVSILGVLLLGLGMVAGQLIGALVLELIVPTGSSGVQPASVVGIVVTLVAVALTALDGRAKRSAPATRGAIPGTADRPRDAREAPGSAAAG